ncbi:MAG TPA: MBL fold metallo-hydrolase, partial [Blastocatellia bacterium]|nr:MBL fold metallo-hydrolase [Blastocatellia bacterium]
MCDVTRREMLIGGAAILGLAATNTHGAVELASRKTSPMTPPEINKVDQLAEDVYFHEGDLLTHGHCNNGWIVFEDYVLVIDAGYPSAAKLILPKIRAITDKPIRFAFDTHHHGDHAYGNQILVDNGAVPIAHTGVLDEMKRYETGYYGGAPGRWEQTAPQRPDVKETRLKPPSVLFPKDLIFDDGKHRVELMHLGVAHTHGDAFAWLPKERIVFTGDACVNGPFNFVADGNVEQWIKTLDAAKTLGARVICPGHGPRDVTELLTVQQQFFQMLWSGVGKLVSAHKAAEDVRAAVPALMAEVKGNAGLARYVGTGFGGQVEKVYTEMTGRGFP